MPPEQKINTIQRTDFFRGVSYTGSYPDWKTCPPVGEHSLVAFTGRSNSGKSSLISALCDHKNLAKVSKTAGKTRTLNYFLVPELDDVPEFYMVDMPGYGYAKLSHSEREHLRKAVDEYLLRENRLSLIIVVLDARRKLGTEEQGILQFCQSASRRCILARPKWDKLNAREKKSARALWKREGVQRISYPLSSTQKSGLDGILNEIRKTVKEGL